jgi:putative acetyltransferase
VNNQTLIKAMNYIIQPITPKHDKTICEIIKKTGEDFGAVGEGFGPSDAEVLAMSQHYSDDTASCYLVATVEDKIVGGSGVAAFNESRHICELRKLFLLPESRGLGIGKRLTEECLKYAKHKGYTQCYLDTLSSMTSAITLYRKLGFKQLKQPLEGTIHNGCDVWMIKDL